MSGLLSSYRLRRRPRGLLSSLTTNTSTKVGNTTFRVSRTTRGLLSSLPASSGA